MNPPMPRPPVIPMRFSPGRATSGKPGPCHHHPNPRKITRKQHFLKKKLE
jgi:hypothetical protein